MADLPEMIRQYLEGPALVRKAVAGMTPEQLRARPVAGKWSTLECVAHLSDFEPILADRIKRIAALDKPTLMGADENLFVSNLAYQERDLEEELRIIEMTRAQLARILRTKGPEVLSRVGVHSERGERTLEQFLQGAINHITHHVGFILEKRKALGLN
jgi:hypothetical protein